MPFFMEKRSNTTIVPEKIFKNQLVTVADLEEFMVSTGMKKPQKVMLLISLVVTTGVSTLLLPPVPQDPAFHEFADTRSWLGIPNFGNVASNFFFLVVAIWGGWELLRRKTAVHVYLIYGVLFAGILLTGIGSACYHWHPDNDRLIWDRMPITIVFMSLLAATVGEWVDRKAGICLLFPLVGLGVSKYSKLFQ
jgi:hypothetical protein